MKLLGLRLCEHDSNISYFDGSSLHYYKSEIDCLVVGDKIYNKKDSWSDAVADVQYFRE